VKRWSGIFAAILLLGLGTVAQAPRESSWVALFNGKDLSGWKKNGDEKWVVEQGTILCESTAKIQRRGRGQQRRIRSCQDCGNRPQHGPDIEGMQVEVDPNMGKHTGGLYETGGRGWVEQPTPEGEQVLKPGNWNELEVSVHGTHIVTQLNGAKIVDFTDPAPKFTDGVIGLQIHTGGGVKMRWKDISIREQ